MWYWHEGMGWWMAFGGILFVLFWGAVIALVVWGISKATERGGTSEKKSPMDIAKERYAKGEISKEEFDNVKKVLS